MNGTEAAQAPAKQRPALTKVYWSPQDKTAFREQAEALGLTESGLAARILRASRNPLHLLRVVELMDPALANRLLNGGGDGLRDALDQSGEVEALRKRVTELRDAHDRLADTNSRLSVALAERSEQIEALQRRIGQMKALEAEAVRTVMQTSARRGAEDAQGAAYVAEGTELVADTLVRHGNNLTESKLLQALVAENGMKASEAFAEVRRAQANGRIHMDGSHRFRLTDTTPGAQGRLPRRATA